MKVRCLIQKEEERDRIGFEMGKAFKRACFQNQVLFFHFLKLFSWKNSLGNRRERRRGSKTGILELV